MQSPVGGCARASVPGYELFGAAFLLHLLFGSRGGLAVLGSSRCQCPLWAAEGVTLSVLSWWDVHWVAALVLVVVSSSLVRLSGYLPRDARVLLHGCLDCQSLPLLATDTPGCAKALTVSVSL